MALLTDGLWISGMEISIDRFDAPIPEHMKSVPVKVLLSQIQIKAIAAVLGLGLENGNVVCYNDEDLDRFMKDPQNSLIEDKYRLMTADEIAKRRVAAKAFEPIIKNKSIADVWNEEGFISGDMSKMNGDGSMRDESRKDTDG